MIHSMTHVHQGHTTKVLRLTPKAGGKTDSFTITTDDQWKLELPSFLDGTGNEMNSMYLSTFESGIS